MKKLISHDELIVDNEQQVFKGLILWLIHNPEQIQDELFENIRFDYLSKEHRDVILNQIREVNQLKILFKNINIDDSLFR